MAGLLVKRFATAYHGLVEVRKAPEKFLRKVLERDLEDKPELPKPFSLGYRIYSESDNSLSVSVSVVRLDEVEQVLKEHPDVGCVVTEEVAFCAYVSKIAKGVVWTAIAHDDSVSLSLIDRGCIVYSTVIPVASIDGSLAEMVNGVLRYALSLFPELPEKGFVTGSKAEEFASVEFLIPFEVVSDLEVSCEEVGDYNLLPPSVIEERKRARFAKLLSISLLMVLVVVAVADLWNVREIWILRERLSHLKPRLESLYRDYEALKKMRQRAKKVEEGLKKREVAFKSFELLKGAYRAYLVFSRRSGLKISELVAQGGLITVKGSVEASAKGEGFILFLQLLGDLRDSGFEIVQKYFEPRRQSFSLQLKVKHEGG